jgi:hypothetical protein
MKTFKFKTNRRPQITPMPSHVSIIHEEGETLLGSVQGKEASAPEERMAKELTKSGKQFLFRYVFGAPKGLPGWKELDFLISSNGLLYAVEVDTAFTHRNKAQKDKLHDALILADRHISSMGTLYPQVFHASGDTDLADQRNAAQYVKNNFGR